MSEILDPNVLMALVDDWLDHDPRTRDSSPGTVKGRKLILIGLQHERRPNKISKGNLIKNWIFKLAGTKEIVYKEGFNNAGWVRMGVSPKMNGYHPKAVPMVQYAKYFIDVSNPAWLKNNDYELVR